MPELTCDLCRAELSEADTLIISGVAFHRSIMACTAVAMANMKVEIERRLSYEAPTLPIVAQEPAQRGSGGL
jgi:hypothetical protein